MVDANTFDNGTPRRFSSRAELYDFMIENGHAFLDGDEAAKMHAYVSKKVGKNANDTKAARIKADIENNNPLLG